MLIETAIRIYFSPSSYKDDVVKEAISVCKAWLEVNPGKKLIDAFKG
jgi:hypothetical protein